MREVALGQIVDTHAGIVRDGGLGPSLGARGIEVARGGVVARADQDRAAVSGATATNVDIGIDADVLFLVGDRALGQVVDGLAAVIRFGSLCAVLIRDRFLIRTRLMVVQVYGDRVRPHIGMFPGGAMVAMETMMVVRERAMGMFRQYVHVQIRGDQFLLIDHGFLGLVVVGVGLVIGNRFLAGALAEAGGGTATGRLRVPVDIRR